MKLRRSLYARPVIVRGEQCAEARLGPRSDTKQLPGHCRGNGRAGSVAIAEPTLVAKPQTPAPQERLGVSRRAALWSWRSRMSECLPCRSSVPLSASHPVRLACPVEGTVSGRTRPGMRCPEPVRSWRPSWTPDTAAWTLDGDQAGGRFGTAGLAEGGHAHCRLSGQSQDEQAAWLAVAGWLGAWSARWAPEVSAAWPSPSGPVRTHRLGGHLELGMSGRPDGQEVRHVRRPVSPLPGVRGRN